MAWDHTKKPEPEPPQLQRCSNRRKVRIDTDDPIRSDPIRPYCTQGETQDLMTTVPWLIVLVGVRHLLCGLDQLQSHRNSTLSASSILDLTSILRLPINRDIHKKSIIDPVPSLSVPT
jgi:hypothetical protein